MPWMRTSPDSPACPVSYPLASHTHKYSWFVYVYLSRTNLSFYSKGSAWILTSKSALVSDRVYVWVSGYCEVAVPESFVPLLSSYKCFWSFLPDVAPIAVAGVDEWNPTLGEVYMQCKTIWSKLYWEKEKKSQVFLIRAVFLMNKRKINSFLVRRASFGMIRKKECSRWLYSGLIIYPPRYHPKSYVSFNLKCQAFS